MAPPTVIGYSSKAFGFLKWFGERHDSLEFVSLRHIDEFMASKREEGWSVRTLASHEHTIFVDGLLMSPGSESYKLPPPLGSQPNSGGSSTAKCRLPDFRQLSFASSIFFHRSPASPTTSEPAYHCRISRLLPSASAVCQKTAQQNALPDPDRRPRCTIHWSLPRSPAKHSLKQCSHAERPYGSTVEADLWVRPASNRILDGIAR